MWFGTRGGGISRYDGKKFVNLTKEDGLAYNSIGGIYQDQDDVMWFGTVGGGVSMYDGIVWSTLDSRDGLPHNNVWSIVQDSDGYLWFAMVDGGVTRYRKNTVNSIRQVLFFRVRYPHPFQTVFA